MNSLQELNTYAQNYVVFQDDRATSVTITTATNQAITINEDTSFSLPNGCEVSAVTSAPDTSTFTVDVGSSGATVTWPDPLPYGMTASTPATGQYRLTGGITEGIWDDIKNPTVQFPDGYDTNTTISCNLNISGVVRNYNVSVTIDDRYNLQTTQNYQEDVGASAVEGEGISLQVTTDNILGTSISGSDSYTVEITQQSPDPATYTGYFQTAIGYYNEQVYGNSPPVTGNITVSGTFSEVNSGDSIIFYVPPVDYTATIVLDATIKETTGGTTTTIKNTDITLTNIYNHAEYSLANSVSHSTVNPGTQWDLPGYEVTDLSSNDAMAYEKDYNVTLFLKSGLAGNLYIGNVNQGDTITLTGNLATVNPDLANVNFRPTEPYFPDGAGHNANTSITLDYSQTQTDDNIVHAGAVEHTVTLTQVADYVTGDYLEGGYVAGEFTYTSGSKSGETHYLIVSPTTSETSAYEWKTSQTSDTFITTEDGETATTTYYTGATYPVGNYCDNYTNDTYTDWYLPAEDELDTIRTAIYVDLSTITGTVFDTGNVATFETGVANADYWTSTVSSTDNTKVRLYDINSGTVIDTIKKGTVSPVTHVSRPIKSVFKE